MSPSRFIEEQDNCFAFNLRADKQQVARLQQALDKVRQGDEYKQLMKRYQLLSILPETTPTIPRLE